jgi:hypothetical protein
MHHRSQRFDDVGIGLRVGEEFLHPSQNSARSAVDEGDPQFVGRCESGRRGRSGSRQAAQEAQDWLR